MLKKEVNSAHRTHKSGKIIVLASMNRHCSKNGSPWIMSQPQPDESGSQESKADLTTQSFDNLPEPAQIEVGRVAGSDNASNESVVQTDARSQPEDADGDYASKWAYIDQHVLIRRTADYCVAITSKIKLDWATTDGFDIAEKALSVDALKSRGELLADVALAEASLCEELSETVRIHYKTLLGEAIVLTFSDQYESATRVLESAGTYIQARNEETSRRWYLASTVTATLVMTIMGLLMWCFREQVTPVLGDIAFWLILSGLFGSLGAMLSVIQRSDKLAFDACAGKVLHWFEGISRVAAGSISAVIVTMAVRSDIILGAFAKGGHLNLVCLLAAVVAGTSERFAGSIISKFDGTASRSGEEANS